MSEIKTIPNKQEIHEKKHNKSKQKLYEDISQIYSKPQTVFNNQISLKKPAQKLKPSNLIKPPSISKDSIPSDMKMNENNKLNHKRGD